MFNPEWGVVNQLNLQAHGEDGPNWLNDPAVGAFHGDRRAHLEIAAFWTLILMTGRLRHLARPL